LHLLIFHFLAFRNNDLWIGAHARTLDVTLATIGVSQGHLSHIERGETEMGAEILLKISREFGKSIEWLLTGEDQKSAREER